MQGCDRIDTLDDSIIKAMSTITSPLETRTGSKTIYRNQAIDILRGTVMIVMALDHVRDFLHEDAMTENPLDFATTTPVLFLTRWITHFCAPIFLFLSGISAWLSGQRRSRGELSAFLIKRGLWLVLIELAIITLGITFNPFYNFFIAQVIWAIGWSMVITGLLVRFLTARVILIVGLAIVALHNLTDYMSLPREGAGGITITALLTAAFTPVPLDASHTIFLVYAILPWTGIMLCGYGLGFIFASSFPPSRRKQLLLRLGIAVISLFILLRLVNLYGDPDPWRVQQNGIFTVLSFVNVTKYPVSLHYTLMTIGIALLLLAVLEGAKGRVPSFLATYGAVPFFYYVLHFYLIHLVCVVVFFASGFGTNQIVDPNSLFLFRPVNFGLPLIWVYVAWIGVVLTLYLPVRWYQRYKLSHRQWWLSYL